MVAQSIPREYGEAAKTQQRTDSLYRWAIIGQERERVNEKEWENENRGANEAAHTTAATAIFAVYSFHLSLLLYSNCTIACTCIRHIMTGTEKFNSNTPESLRSCVCDWIAYIAYIGNTSIHRVCTLKLTVHNVNGLRKYIFIFAYGMNTLV